MAQYIDKAAVVAEIERRIRKMFPMVVFSTIAKGVNMQLAREELRGLLSFLNTLEVKEVDLENSVKGRIDYPFIGYDYPNIYPNYKELKDYCDKNGIKDEDKVKIIIIKDDIL